MGESMFCDSTTSEKFKKEFDDLIKKKLMADQIYTVNESGLFYWMLQSKTLAAKTEESAKCYKKSKDRLYHNGLQQCIGQKLMSYYFK